MNNGLKPSCWGAPAWHFLHSVAMGYPETVKNRNSKVYNEYFEFFTNLGNVLPCEWCKEHYNENIKIMFFVLLHHYNVNLSKSKDRLVCACEVVRL